MSSYVILNMFFQSFSVGFTSKTEENYSNCVWYWDICNVLYIWVCNSILLETYQF